MFVRLSAMFLCINFVFLPNIVLKYGYYPTHELTNINDPALKDKVQDLYLNTPDNVKINLWYLKAQNNKPTIIFCHGDAGNLSDYQTLLKTVADQGLGLVLWDYRGFGKSSGKPEEKGIYTDLKTVIQYLNKENVPDDKIVLWGYSFGGAIVAEIASHDKFKGAILHSTFTNQKEQRTFEIERKLNISNGSIKDSLLKSFIKIIPLRDQKYDTLAKVKNITSPLLIAHDIPDNVVPVEMSYKLLKANPNAQAFISKTGSHDDFNWVLGRALTFINSLN